MKDLLEFLGDKLKGMSFAIIVVLHKYFASTIGAEKGSSLDFLAWTGAIIVSLLIVIIPVLIGRRRWVKHKQGRLFRLAKKHPKFARFVAFLMNVHFTLRHATPDCLEVCRDYWNTSSISLRQELKNAASAIRTEGKTKKARELDEALKRKQKLNKQEEKADNDLAKINAKS